MSKKINAVIVVEGKTDQAFLESFIEADIVLTNGSDVPRETIDYLKELARTRTIIVLTDPDNPGKRIRSLIENSIPEVQHAFIEKKYCIKGHKVGIAESDKEHVLSALEHLCSTDASCRGSLTTTDLFSLGLMGREDSSRLRHCVSNHFHVGHNNAKSLLKRLNCLNVSLLELEQFIKEIQNGYHR